MHNFSPRIFTLYFPPIFTTFGVFTRVKKASTIGLQFQFSQSLRPESVFKRGGSMKYYLLYNSLRC